MKGFVSFILFSDLDDRDLNAKEKTFYKKWLVCFEFISL